MFTAAVDMDKDRPLITLLILLAQRVDLSATLLEPTDLIEWDCGAHAGLALTVIQELLVAYTILGVLYDNVHLGASHKQVPRQTQHDIVSVLILMQRMGTHFSNSAWIRATMPANQVKAGSFQIGRGDIIFSQRLSEKRLIILPSLARRALSRVLCGGLTLGRQFITHTQYKRIVLSEFTLIQFDKLTLARGTTISIPLQECGDAITIFRISGLCLGLQWGCIFYVFPVIFS